MNNWYLVGQGRDVRHQPNDMIAAVEAAKQGVTVGEDIVSGLMFADDFLGKAELPPKDCRNKWRRHPVLVDRVH